MPLKEKDIKAGNRVILTRAGILSWNCEFSFEDVSDWNPLYSIYECKGTITSVTIGEIIAVNWDNGFTNVYGPDHLDLADCIQIVSPVESLQDVIPYDPYGRKKHAALMAAHRERELSSIKNVRDRLNSILRKV